MFIHALVPRTHFAAVLLGYQPLWVLIAFTRLVMSLLIKCALMFTLGRLVQGHFGWRNNRKSRMQTAPDHAKYHSNQSPHHHLLDIMIS